MSTASAPSIFALGTTGYIGGAALHGIFEAYPSFKVSALVRSAKDDKAVSSAFGNARIVRGSFSDLDVIEEEASKADFVLNCADADDLKVVEAILRGLKKQYESKGKKPVYLHTSGTGVLTQGRVGKWVKEAEKIWNDASEEDMRSIAINQPHRKIDLAIMKANDEGYVDAFIIAPSAIYGTGSGPGRTESAQIPDLIRVAIARRQVVRYGDGTNEWNFVHIDDLEKLYVLVAKLALSGKDKEGAFGRFYVGSGEMHQWSKVHEALVPILKARGKIDTTEIGTVTREEERGPRGYMPSTGSNSRSKADRGIAIGWKFRPEGVWETLEKTVDATIEEYGL